MQWASEDLRCESRSIGRLQPYISFGRAGGGTRTPTGNAHQDLNLARLPFPPHPRVLPAPSSSLGWRTRTVGGSPGTRTRNLRIKSPMLCQIELATQTRG